MPLNYFLAIIKVEFKKYWNKKKGRKEWREKKERQKKKTSADYPFCSPVLATGAQVTPPGLSPALLCE